MKLLFIDDNQALIKNVADCLGDDWQVTPAGSGYEGLKLAKSGKYDIIVLRLKLPDLSGHDICHKLRQANISSPIMVLSAINQPDTKVRLFQAGADDYVTKPFDINEFKARLMALLRRGHLETEASHLLKVDDLVLDPLQRQVQRAGKKIALRRKENARCNELARRLPSGAKNSTFWNI